MSKDKIFASAGVVTATPRVIQLFYAPATITVIPAAGTTALVEYSTTPINQINSGNGVWREWPAGAVTDTTSDAITAPVVAFRVSRTAGGGNVNWEVNQ